MVPSFSVEGVRNGTASAFGLAVVLGCGRFGYETPPDFESFVPTETTSGVPEGDTDVSTVLGEEEIGSDCESGSECNSGVCKTKCEPPSCTDGIRNGDETDVDCGGVCGATCGTGDMCGGGPDCNSGFCDGTLHCAAAACDDRVHNGDELGVDCGGSCPCAAPCAYGPFGAPTQDFTNAVNSLDDDWAPTISGDGRTLIFHSWRPGLGVSDLWVSTRPVTTDPFSSALLLGVVNSSVGDYEPFLSSNELELFFSSDRSGGSGGVDLWYASRATVGDSFSTPVNISELNTAVEDRDPALSPDGLTLYYDTWGGPGSWSIFSATRSAIGATFGTGAPVANINSTDRDFMGSVSTDGFELFFWSDRPGGLGGSDIWVARRPTSSSEFGTPENVTEVNSSGREEYACISYDGLTLYLGYDTEDDAKIWSAARSCVGL